MDKLGIARYIHYTPPHFEMSKMGGQRGSLGHHQRLKGQSMIPNGVTLGQLVLRLGDKFKQASRQADSPCYLALETV